MSSCRWRPVKISGNTGSFIKQVPNSRGNAEAAPGDEGRHQSRCAFLLAQ